MIMELIFYALSGFFMKISDELLDESNHLYLAIITGLLCVFFSLALSTTNGDATCIFLSILIGTALAKKVDSINHVISAIVFVVLLALINIPYFSWYALLLCIIAAVIDEKGNDISDELEAKGKSSERNFFYKFFKYRYALKLAVFLLSLLGLLKIMYGSMLSGFDFFAPVTIIYFYAFDLSYEAAGLLFERFNYLL